MENEQALLASPQTSPAASVGTVLRTAREAHGLTVADVAERIKFSVKQVEALESDDFAVLPEGTFLRGFVRSYARTLGVDEAKLLTMMAPANELHGDISEVQAGGLAFGPVPGVNAKNLTLLVLALLIAVGLSLFVWFQKESPSVETVVLQDIKLPALAVTSAVAAASSSVEAVSAVAAIAPQPIQPVPVTKVEEAAKVSVAPAKDVVPPKVVAPVPAVAESKPKVAVAPVVVAMPAAEKSSLPLDQLKKRPIHIVFAEDTWMEIKDTNGELLLSRMNAAGTEKWIGGNRRAPYQVAIGKVGAVKIFYKGREVDLSKYSPTGVVRLVLE